MPSVASCKVGSAFNLAAGDLLNAVVAFAIAWRAQAVARGVMQTRRSIRLMQLLVGMLVVSVPKGLIASHETKTNSQMLNHL